MTQQPGKDTMNILENLMIALKTAEAGGTEGNRL
jgi:hypothetical protein